MILERNPKVTEKLIACIQNLHVQTSEGAPKRHEIWPGLSSKERLEYALKGIGDYLRDNLQEALRTYSYALIWMRDYANRRNLTSQDCNLNCLIEGNE